MSRFVVIGFFVVYLAACSSQKNLAIRYEKVSEDISALEEELKAIVRLEYALESYDQRKAAQEEIRLRKIRRKNRRDNLPVGPPFPHGLTRAQKLATLNRNYHTISDRIYQLQKQRNKIVRQQVGEE